MVEEEELLLQEVVGVEQEQEVLQVPWEVLEEQQVVLVEQLELVEAEVEEEHSCSLSGLVSALVVVAAVVDKLRYTVVVVDDDSHHCHCTDQIRTVKEVDLQSWFCGDLALLQETVEAVMEAGETCWVRSGVAGGQLTSQRTFCPRDASCRTGHSLNSGGTGHIS